MTSVLISILALLSTQDADDKKTSRQIFIEGQRLETVRGDYDRAIDQYNKAIGKAKTEGKRRRVAESLRNIARCYESMESENVGGAMDAYNRIVDDYDEFDDLAEYARQKLEWKGVDTWLARYAAKLVLWRDRKDRGSAEALEEFRGETWDKIQGLGTGAIPGLLAGLGHPDEVVRAFAGDNLARVTNDRGVADIISHLESSDPVTRGGAALALEKVFVIWKQARDLDDRAETIMKNFNTDNLGDSTDDILEKAISRAKDQASNLRDKAEEIRGNLPRNLNGTRIQDSLARVISDEDADPTARLEAAGAALSIGSISGKLVEALAKGMRSRDRNVRVGCAMASAAVDTEKSADKHSLADVMAELVQYVPSRDWSPSRPDRDEEKTIREAITRLASDDEMDSDDAREELLKIGDSIESLVRSAAYRSSGENHRSRFHTLLSELEQRRWANDPFVREAMARALGEVGLIKGIPALIRSLEDTSFAVRKAGNDALVSLTGLDFDFDPNPHVKDPGLERDPPTILMDEADKREKQAAIRAEGIRRWTDWWKRTRGVSVLMDRFWKFQAQWKAYDPAKLFDKDLLLKEITRTSSDLTREFNLARAERLHVQFHRQKDVFVMDAVDLGTGAIDAWMQRLDGANPEQEMIFGKVAPAQKKILVGKSRDACRHFVAQVIARLAGKSGNGSSIARRLRSGVSAGGEKGAGAALALGNLDRRDVDGSCRRSLNEALGGYSDILKESAALALMRVGDAENASNLIVVAVAAARETQADSPKVRASIAALRALAVLKPRDKLSISKLGELVGDEPEDKLASKKALLAILRKFACEALENMADASIAPMILRARRDTIGTVRSAAASAIRKIHTQDSTMALKFAGILKNEDTPPADRIGAALALGDTGQAARAYDLVYRIMDENAPRVLRDPDPAVRAAACRALGEIGDHSQFTIEALFAGMSDDAEEVRQQAYASIRRIVGKDVAKKHTLKIREGEGKNAEDHEYKGWYSESDRNQFLKTWRAWYKRNKGNFTRMPPRDA